MQARHLGLRHGVAAMGLDQRGIQRQALGLALDRQDLQLGFAGADLWLCAAAAAQRHGQAGHQRGVVGLLQAAHTELPGQVR